MAQRHLIGLLLATEEDWPSAFESVLGRLGPIRHAGETHEFACERITNQPFDLERIGERVGYPLYMKPFDGGQWIGVTRISSPEELRTSYDESGERLMHVQGAVEDFDVFTRSLSIGPQTLVAKYDPSAHGHYRYLLEREFLSIELEREVATISRLVNAFFRWEFNSCETIVKD